MTISAELQTSIQDKIETAFQNGTGDYFMQLNDFSQVVCVKSYQVESMTKKGYSLFSLFTYERPCKEKKAKAIQPHKAEIKKEVKIKRTYNRFDNPTGHGDICYSDADNGL